MKKTMCGIIKESAGAGLSYITDLPVPEIAGDEILIKVKVAAVCGTDAHIYEWDRWSQLRMKPPVIIGHEIAGDVIEAGAAVKGVRVGDRVSVESHIPCRQCWFCQNGLEHICKNTGLFGVTQNGGFAEYAKIRYDCAFLLDDSLSYEQGCMFEPMGAGVHGVSAAMVRGKSVLISGCGPIGLTAVTAAKVFGARLVIACDLLDQKLDIARGMGADYVINSSRESLPERVREITGGAGADAAIDITGSGAAITAALKSLRAAGRMVSVGLPSREVTLDLTEDIIYREIEYTGVSGREIWRTWEQFAAVLKDPRYKPERILGQKFALCDFEKAFEAIKSGATGKMLLYP